MDMNRIQNTIQSLFRFYQISLICVYVWLHTVLSHVYGHVTTTKTENCSITTRTPHTVLLQSHLPNSNPDS